ncbi:MAG TPA: transposase [Balneolaceae bacterium]
MPYNRKKHNRRSIRLQGYDYSSPGQYFVTICTQNRECLLGKIKGCAVSLNEMGSIAEKFWQKIPKRYENVELDSHIVMPNHFHGIVKINDGHVGVIHESPLRGRKYDDLRETDPEQYRKKRRNMLLPKIIGWYKMNVSKRINQIQGTPGEKVWQRNYYEHIIRDDQSLERIRYYIINNPARWEEDQNNPQNF